MLTVWRGSRLVHNARRTTTIGWAGTAKDQEEKRWEESKQREPHRSTESGDKMVQVQVRASAAACQSLPL